jgi:hypothetical protein
VVVIFIILVVRLNDAVEEPVAVEMLALGLSFAPFKVALKPIFTVMFIGEDVVIAPELSVAFAVMECGPAAAFDHV